MPSRVAAGEGRLPLAGATGNGPVISLSSHYCPDGRDGRSRLVAIRVEVARTDAHSRLEWLPVLERAIRARSFRGRARKKAHSRKRKIGKTRTGLPRNAGVPLLPKHVVPLCVGNLLGHGRSLCGNLVGRRASDRHRRRAGAGTLWHQPLLRGSVGSVTFLDRRRRKRPRTRMLRNAVLLHDICDKIRGTAVLARRAKAKMAT